MFSPDRFLTHTLERHPWGPALTRILAAAIQAVEPGAAVRRFVRRQGRSLRIADREYDVRDVRRLIVLGLGKASPAMVLALSDLLPLPVSRGLVIGKHVSSPLPAGFELILGDHPIPGLNSLRAGQRAIELVSGLEQDDLLICLISGGGSALMTAPQPGLALDDVQALTSALLACGAPIHEINILRRRLDRVKAGGLARLAAPARVASLILSDVIGDPLEAIASGPTAPDPSTRHDALAVLERYDLRSRLPQAVIAALHAAPETPKPGDPLFERVQNVIVGSNALAAEAAGEQARREGIHPIGLGSDWQGEARQAGSDFARRLLALEAPRPACLIAGGETTVAVSGPGRGGRNQEAALAAVPLLAGRDDRLMVTLATDGEDGPTDAAGAVVAGDSLLRGLAQGLDVETHLATNNSHAYFDALGDLLRPGPTGTNVNDLWFGLAV